MATRNIPRRLQLVGLFLVVVGARLWLIGEYGNALPFWDQWHAEGLTILKPWIEGNLTSEALFAPHNEHRIVLTRLLALGVFALNWQWDNLLQMTVNAGLCGLIAILMAIAIFQTFPPSFRWPGLVALISLFALPFAWENTLAGFQSQFYFLLLFSLIAMWGLGLFLWRSAAWWAGVIALILACLSMASGFFAALAVAGLHFLRCLRERRWPSASSIITLLLCLVTIVAGLMTRTPVEGHSNLQAESLTAWLVASGRCLAWPWTAFPLLALVMQLPLLILALVYLLWPVKFPEEGSRRPVELLLVVGLWYLGQSLAMAYVRGGQNLPPASRYMDLLAIGALVNFGAAFTCAAKIRTGAWKIVLPLVSLAWLGLAGWGLFSLTQHDFAEELPGRRAILATEEQNVRGYVRSGNEKYLKAKPFMALPYPDVDTLQGLLDDETIRSILPAGVRPRLPLIGSATGSSPGFLPRGFPPTVFIPAYEKIWGSYSPPLGEAVEGEWRPELATAPKLPYLRIEVSGHLGEPNLNLALRSEISGKQIALRPSRTARDKWQIHQVPVPADQGKLTVVAHDRSPAGWFAFSEPAEVGRFSYWNLRLLPLAPAIFGTGVLILLIVASLQAVQRARARLATTGP